MQENGPSPSTICHATINSGTGLVTLIPNEWSWPRPNRAHKCISFAPSFLRTFFLEHNRWPVSSLTVIPPWAVLLLFDANCRFFVYSVASMRTSNVFISAKCVCVLGCVSQRFVVLLDPSCPDTLVVVCPSSFCFLPVHPWYFHCLCPGDNWRLNNGGEISYNCFQE